MAGSMSVVFICLALVGRHVPRREHQTSHAPSQNQTARRPSLNS
jgi:hypothetical protein